MDAYTRRRHSEITQLWMTLRHAHGGEEDHPGPILPRLPEDDAPADDREPGFDPVALVRRANERG